MHPKFKRSAEILENLLRVCKENKSHKNNNEIYSSLAKFVL